MEGLALVLACATVTALLAGLLAGDGALDEGAAVEVARRELSRLGYDLDSLAMLAAGHDAPWYARPDPERPADRAARLRGSRYWTVAFRPKGGSSRGGNGCVFVDARRGAVLATFLGK